MKKPTFVYKKELSKIPLYGTYLKHLNMIGVDRSGGSKSLKNLLVEVKKRADQGYALVIFPEGTRTKPFESVKFKPGVSQIYLDEKIAAPIIPTALNSGHHWSKGRLDIPPGKIVVEFLPAIEGGLNRGEFVKRIQSDVEDAYKAIIEQNDQAS
jgi:1-acyl-sn-glycerol-3-phosphate acyltransferase